ncbi:MAG: hypothetical protein KGJ89_05170 [Patescibacteria group bacterium]|nr:hypothetical protein [Patescibacteria group bacterium]MDE2227313.1 hypothetical protein [Patescibacteria group bacterium]
MNKIKDKIIAMPGKVWISPQNADAAGLDTSSLDLAAEEGTVLVYVPRQGVESPPELKEGAYVYFKSYGVVSVEVDGEKYFVIDVEFKAILGIKK